jgi:regulator of sigma E protease
MLYIIVAIIIFGFLIAIHEFGHFFTAKLFGVKVNEFSIGMGPALLKKQKGETLYSLRLLPIGGYCAMEGEDEDSQEPRAFGQAKVWKQIVILAAGAFMNFLAGLLFTLIIFSQAGGFVLPNLDGYLEGYGTESSGLLPGDVFYAIDGHRIYNYGDLTTFLSRAGDTLDLVVKRDGVKVRLNDVYMPLQERTAEDGTTTYLRGITIGREILPATVGNKLLYSWYNCVDFVRTVWMSLGDLVSGAVGLRDLSGPVGIVDAISQVGSQSESAVDAAYNILYFAALIAVNLAVMNLLPLPALDGGRIFFLLVNTVLYGLFRRKIAPKYEGYVHLAGLALLMGLSLVVTFSDVGKLLGR